MKRIIEAYISFSRTERNGILALCALIFILLMCRAFMSYWVKGAAPVEHYSNRTMAQLKQNVTNNVPKLRTAESENRNISQQNATLFSFDPNTIDSIGLRQLGMKEKTAHIFLNWRRKGKRFYSKEELRSLYTLTEAEYLRLEPYIIISNGLHAYHDESIALPDAVNINTADSALLVRLRGIGPAIAHKIVTKRNKQPFSDISQVFALYHFRDDVKQYLQEKIVFK